MRAVREWGRTSWTDYMTHIGRRGLMLFILAIMFGLYGITLISAPPHAAWWPAYQGQLLMIPILTWGLVWVGCSIIMLLGAPLRHDQGSYAVAAGMTSLWGFCAIWTSPYWGPGVIYTGLSLLIMLCAGWPDVRLYSPKLAHSQELEKWDVRLPSDELEVPAAWDVRLLPPPDQPDGDD